MRRSRRRQEASSRRRQRFASAATGASSRSRLTWRAAVSCQSCARSSSSSRPVSAAFSGVAAGRPAAPQIYVNN